MSVVDEIKARLDIVDVVGSYVQLKKSGRTFKGLCPFHSEKTASFIVNQERQTWHCFGACGTGGDIFSFIQRAENVDFPGALRLLADRAGVEIAPRSPSVQAEDDLKSRLYAVNDAAAQFFNSQLMHSPAASSARAYLEKRQVDAASCDRFGLGYAPDSWDGLLTALTARNYRTDDLAAAGLVIEREGGGYYDRFRGRLIFPIRDERGQTIGFGGRTLGDGVPKYLNSPQTLLFDKGGGLYGLDLARETIRRAGTVVVVEGYMDVVSLHQRGFQNVVASLGTALTEAQVTLAARYAPSLVLALDADTAGNAATLRGLQVAARAVATQKRRGIGPGGRLSTVEKRAIDLRITVLPPGLDPDDLVKQNPAEWERRVAASKPVPEYYFSALVSDLDLNTSTGKEEAAERLLPVIRDELDSPVEKAHYLQWLARLTRVDERQYGERLRELNRRAPHQSTPQPRAPTPANGQGREVTPAPPASRRQFGLEEYVLGLLMREPGSIGVLQNTLTGQGFAALTTADFNAGDNQALLEALSDNGDVSGDLTLNNHAKAVAAYTESMPGLDGDKLIETATKVVLRMRQGKRQQEIQQLEFLIAEARREGDTIAGERYELRMKYLSSEMVRLMSALYQASPR
ncbi:MAG: DNA primase [Anaerolineae bacterium]